MNKSAGDALIEVSLSQNIKIKIVLQVISKKKVVFPSKKKKSRLL
jgi:hypothetical protein